ncbi:MAG: polysaccharide pyruvyl transferase family protein [Neisseriaceae bacterium]|nr:polysaccharide pyruvyl transferase family protein [Neisseriaceae bacterium]
MKKVSLIGYFNYGNFGDELFMKAHQQYLGEYFDLSVPMDLLEQPYFSRDVREIVNETDAFLIGGGDLLNPMRVSPLYWNLEYLNKPVFIFGLGVPNQKFVRENVKSHYEKFLHHHNCKLIITRDKESYDFIKHNYHLEDDKLSWFPDPVLSLALSPRVSRVKGEKVLGVVMREHRSLAEDMGALRKLIDTAKQMDYKIRHIVLANKFLGIGDFERAKRIALPDEPVFHYENLDDMIVAISGCDILATIKFHGMVVATRYKIPSIAMSTTPKNRNFLRMLERTEMLCGYGDENLYKHLPYYPASIHSQVVYRLVKQSQAGYIRLLSAMKSILG